MMQFFSSFGWLIMKKTMLCLINFKNVSPSVNRILIYPSKQNQIFHDVRYDLMKNTSRGTVE